MGVGYRWAQAQVCPGQSGGRRSRELPWGLAQGSPEVAAGGGGAQGRGSGHRAQAPVTTALSHTLCGVGSVGFGSRTGRADDRVLPGPLPR